MKRVHLLAASAALFAATPVTAAPVASPAPAVERYTQCLLLYLAAAGDGKDEKVQQAAIVGSWYFLGKLDATAPGLDLVQALREKVAALQVDPRADEIGAACDTELSTRGTQLLDIGKQLKDSN
jgi:hypothetical protein